MNGFLQLTVDRVVGFGFHDGLVQYGNTSNVTGARITKPPACKPRWHDIRRVDTKQLVTGIQTSVGA